MTLEWLSLGLSVLALLLAVIAILKLRAFQFRPDVLAGDVILPRQSSSRGMRLLLPLQFSNAGNADGIVEWLAVRLTPDGDLQRSVLLKIGRAHV